MPETINSTTNQTSLEHVMHIYMPRNEDTRESQVSSVSGFMVHRLEFEGDASSTISATITVESGLTTGVEKNPWSGARSCIPQEKGGVRDNPQSSGLNQQLAKEPTCSPKERGTTERDWSVPNTAQGRNQNCYMIPYPQNNSKQLTQLRTQAVQSLHELWGLETVTTHVRMGTLPQGEMWWPWAAGKPSHLLPDHGSWRKST